MIYAALKGLHSPDNSDLPSYKPENSENFGFLLQLLVGPAHQAGEEAFEVTVCTPQWLTNHYSKEDIIIGRHHLIVFEYNYARLIQRIETYLRQCSGDTWQQVAEKVGRLGRWEFEDYQAVD